MSAIEGRTDMAQRNQRSVDDPKQYEMTNPVVRRLGATSETSCSRYVQHSTGAARRDRRRAKSEWRQPITKARRDGVVL